MIGTDDPRVPARGSDLLAYLEAILRVYNRYGRRDNIYKARIKILVARDRRRGDRATRSRPSSARSSDGALDLPRDEIDAHRAPTSRRRPSRRGPRRARRSSARSCATRAFAAGLQPQRRAAPACRATRIVDDLAEADRRRRRATPPPSRWTPSPTSPSAISFGEVRVTPRAEPGAAARRAATTCRRSTRALRRGRPRRRQHRPDHRHHRLPRARLLRARQRALDPDRAAHLRALRRPRRASTTSASSRSRSRGCINACGHHHVGHIGILGVDKNGDEFYQITLGGDVDVGKTPRSARSSARRSRPTRWSMRSRRWSTPISTRAPSRRALRRHLSPHRAPSPSRSASMALFR